MKVSVIAFINNEEGWEATITSVLEQTYANLELLLVNTGDFAQNIGKIQEFLDTDSRVRICENFQSRRDVINGQYIMKMSKGLILKSDAVERMIKIFQRRKNEVFIYADVLPVNQNDEILADRGYLNEELENFYLYNPLRKCFICKKEVYERVGGFHLNGIYDADNDFCIRILECGFPVYHFRAKICRYRVDENMLRMRNKEDVLNFRIKKFREEIRKRRGLVIKIKVLNELIDQCKKYERYQTGICLAVYCRMLQNPMNQIRLKRQKILNQSRAAFDILADGYEQDGGYDEPRKCYQPVMKIIRKYAVGNFKLLDVGCGPGIMLQKVLRTFPEAAKIDGIDLSVEMVKFARRRLLDERACVVEGTIDTISFPMNFYDIELCMHSFHHYPKPLKSLLCMNRVLRKGGVLIIADNYYKGLKRLEQNFNLYANEYSYGDMWMYSMWELVILTYMSGFHKQRFYKIGDKSFIFICQKR